MKTVTSLTFEQSIDDRPDDINPEYFLPGVIDLKPGNYIRHKFQDRSTTFRITEVDTKITFDPSLGGSIRHRIAVKMERV